MFSANASVKVMSSFERLLMTLDRQFVAFEVCVGIYYYLESKNYLLILLLAASNSLLSDLVRRLYFQKREKLSVIIAFKCKKIRSICS